MRPAQNEFCHAALLAAVGTEFNDFDAENMAGESTSRETSLLATPLCHAYLFLIVFCVTATSQSHSLYLLYAVRVKTVLDVLHGSIALLLDSFQLPDIARIAEAATKLLQAGGEVESPALARWRELMPAAAVEVPAPSRLRRYRVVRATRRSR